MKATKKLREFKTKSPARADRVDEAQPAMRPLQPYPIRRG
jgi:hypothetical protein